MRVGSAGSNQSSNDGAWARPGVHSVLNQLWLAPTAIKAWIEAARISNVPDHKLESAHETIEAIEGWPGDRHYPD